MKFLASRRIASDSLFFPFPVRKRWFNVYNESLCVGTSKIDADVCRSFPGAANRKEYVYKRSTGKVAINSDSLSLRRADTSSRERGKGASRSYDSECHGQWEDRHCPPFLRVFLLPAYHLLLRSLLAAPFSLAWFSLSLFLSFPLDVQMRAVRFIQMCESGEWFEMPSRVLPSFPFSVSRLLSLPRDSCVIAKLCCKWEDALSKYE